MCKAILAALILSTGLVVQAENWPQWRGPLFNGSSPEQGLPSEWSKTNNVAWNVDLPGPSAATPIVWDNLVLISSTDQQNQTLLALAVDRRTGKVLWQHKISDGIRHDRQSTMSAPSPITDGQRAIFFYSNGELVAFDLAGNKQWSRNLQTDYGAFAFLWTFSSTPLLFEGKLYLQVLQRDVPVSNRRGRPEASTESANAPIDSYLLAMDPATGKTLWRQTRPSHAVAESHEAYSTPMPFTFQGRTELLVVGGDSLTGHDPASGKELWRWETWNPSRIGHWRQVVSPVAGDGVILVCAPKSAPVYALKAGGAGTLDATSIVWKSDQNKAVSSDVPSPLFYQGDFFVLNDSRKCLSRVEPASGKVKWTTESLGHAKFEASPTGADGKIYMINFTGEVSVVNAEDGVLLRTVPMGEAGDDQIRSTVAVAHRQLFIRTNTRLYCVGKER